MTSGNPSGAAPLAGTQPQPAHRQDRRARAYVVAFVAAATAHTAFLLALDGGLETELAATTGDTGVEVLLIAAAPAPEEVNGDPAELPDAAPPLPELPAEALELVASTPAPAASPANPGPDPEPPGTKATAAVTKRVSPRIVKTPRALQGGASIPSARTMTSPSGAAGDRAQPSYLRNPHPTYPEEARRAGQHGVVQIRVRVNADGSVASVGLVRSSGFPMLDQRALSTVRRRWSFKPARAAGLPIASEVIVPIRFSLGN